MDTNPTQLAGLIALGASTAASGWAAQARPGWRAIALIHALLWLDILVSARHALHDLLADTLRTIAPLGDRHPVQWAALAVLAALAVAGLVRVWRAGGALPLRAARLATAGLVGVCVLEVISLHDIDTLLYRRGAVLPVIAWLWIAGASVTAVSALRSR